MVRYSAKKFRPFEPDTYRNMQYTPGQCLKEDDLVFFLLEIIEHLDLSAFYAPYQTELRGAPPFNPAKMLCLLLYAYCIGVFSSRKMAKACEFNMAFRAIVGDDIPNFRTISDFRKDHLELIEDIFLQVLKLAAEAGLVGLGNISFDGSKFKADASRHKAMSYGYMKKEEERLKAEIKALLEKANEADRQDEAAHGARRGDELPEELKRREERLAAILAAKARLEAQAKQEAEQERQRRAAEEAQRQSEGKSRKGPEPKPVSDVPDDKDQCSFTDPEAKMMPQSNKGWDYAGNCQASMDGAFGIIIAAFVTVATNDKEQAIPLAEATMSNLKEAGIELPKDENGQDKKIPATADSGYYSKEAAEGVEKAGMDPYMATGRQKHNQPVQPVQASDEASQTQQSTTAQPAGTTEAKPAEAKPAEATEQTPSQPGKKAKKPRKPTAEEQAKQKMTEKVKTEKGRELYSRRKVIAEPVFGQIKEARGFRQFSLRGLEKMNGEWQLICLTHNLLKLARYAPGRNRK